MTFEVRDAGIWLAWKVAVIGFTPKCEDKISFEPAAFKLHDSPANSQNKNTITVDYVAIAGNMLAMIAARLAKHTLTL